MSSEDETTSATTTIDAENRKPFKIKDVTRGIKKAVVAASLEEMRTKAAEKFGKIETMPTIHFDCDGTEVDDEEYFRTLEPNAELIAVFPGERWVDATHYVTISSRRLGDDDNDNDQTDAENAQLKKLVGQLQNNLCDVSVVSGPDLDSLSNMDPNSLVDITGKEYLESIKESSGRLRKERTSSDAAELLKRLTDEYCKEARLETIEATSSAKLMAHKNFKQSTHHDEDD